MAKVILKTGKVLWDGPDEKCHAFVVNHFPHIHSNGFTAEPDVTVMEDDGTVVAYVGSEWVVVSGPSEPSEVE